MPNPRRQLRKLAESLTGTRIFQHLPQGVDLFEDLRRILPEFRPTVIFDVGANIGETAQLYAEVYPQAQIHAFEPVPENFARLEAATGELTRVTRHMLGMSSTPGECAMASDDAHTNYALTNDDSKATSVVASVAVTTLDAFTTQHSIAHVSLLKIDTEGHDLEVLKGAEGLLRRSAVDVIEVEAGMHAANTRHVPFAEFVAYLSGYGYALFGMYEQMREFTSPQLRRCNPVFISRPLIDARDQANT